MIEKYLQDLECRIDPQVEENLFGQWRVFADGPRSMGVPPMDSGSRAGCPCYEGIFSPKRPRPSPSSIEWPHVLVNDALEDCEAMALQQLELCSKALAEGSGALLAVRCNYGTAILPSLFGGELFLMDRDIDTLPACRPLEGGAEAVKRLLDQGVPDLEAGLGATTFRMGQYFKQLFHDYPRLSKYVYVYHPDLQGPMNVCEMLWGSSLYVDLYDKPDLVRDFLSLITETYIRFMRRWDEMVAESSTGILPVIPNPWAGRPCYEVVRGRTTYEETPHGVATNYAVHWSMLHRGRIMVRDDAATNLSPAMYEDFALACDQRLLDELGGGAIHFCGRGDHLITKLSQLSGIHAVNTTQPALNNVETIFANTIDKQINLLGFEREIADQALQRGRPLWGRVHCW
jgi:hypothetical protein